VIPANSLVGGAGPNPFYVIDFTTPFLYTGGDLLITDTNPGNKAFAVDAVSVNSVAATAACNGGVCGVIYNFPVTELLATPAAAIPEPSSLLLCLLLSGTVLAGAAVALKRKSVS
jgi:hypothetical protein